MAIDIYSKQRELQKQLEDQQQRLTNAGSMRNSEYDDYVQKFKSGDANVQKQFGSLSNVQQKADEAAKGAQSAETHAANVEIDKYKKQLAEEDQRVNTVKPFAELQEKQEMRAKEFRTAFPSILDSKLGQARTAARREIADGVNTARAGYNQRGLLYSGMRAGAEADVGADAENKLAEQGVQTQQELMNQANELDQDAIDTGMQIGNISKDMAGTSEEYRKSIIDMLLNKDQQRQQALGGLLGTGAQLAGYGLGAAIK